MPHTEIDDLIGLTVDRYKITRKLGEGGMGAVYLAEHASIGSRVAIKVLHPEYARRKPIVERFFAEAQAVNRIRHENIVQIVDLALLPDHRPYLIMEYLDGQPLSSLLERGQGMDLALTMAVGAQIVDALAAAHEHKIVHRDLKPDNVFLVPRKRGAPRVKLLDFGIAKLMDDGDVQGAQTRTGAILGTPRYMSPEQAAGRTREIDSRSDVYSFGIILYEMLTGQVPFKAQAFGDLMLLHLTKPPEPPRSVRPEIPEAIEAVVLRCLAKLSEDRYQRIEEVGEVLRSTLEGLGAVGLLPDGEGASRPGERSAGGTRPPSTSGSKSGPPTAGGTRHEASSPAAGPGTLTSAGAELRTPAGGRTGRMVAIAVGVSALLSILGFVAFRGVFGSPDTDESESADDDAPARRDDARGAKPPRPEPDERARDDRRDEAGETHAASAAPDSRTAELDPAPPASAPAVVAAGKDAAPEKDRVDRAADGAVKVGKGAAGVAKGALGVAKDALGVAKGVAGKKKGTAAPRGTPKTAKTLDDSTLPPDL